MPQKNYILKPCRPRRILRSFSGLSTDVRRNALLWEGFFGREGAADAQLPDPWASDLSLFQKLVLTRFLWPDQVRPTFHSSFNLRLRDPQIEIPEPYL